MTKTLSLGPFPVQSAVEAPSRMALLLWGQAGAGKTTWAATAPGDKLWLSFGDNEHVSISHRKDVHVVSLADVSYDELFKHGGSDNPFGLDRFLAENENFETVVVDSATAIQYRGLQKAVADKVGAGRGFTPTMQVPGMAAYGGRNSNLLEVVSGILRVTAKHNCHVVITAHEDDPVMKQEGNAEIIDYIAINLGGKLINNVSWRLSEIWNIRALTNGERVVTVRTHGQRRPMKSRMFNQSQSAFFTLGYTPDKPDKNQMTIASFHNAWIDNGKRKIDVPNTTTEKKK